MKMSNDFLSQEEIDALLNRGSSDSVSDDVLDDEDKDLLGEIGNICMGSAATTLSVLINQPVSITTPKVEVTTLGRLKETFEVPNVAIEVKFTSGLNGVNLLVLKLPDAGVIANLMMGGNGEYNGKELGEIELSAVSESMNQMIGTSATSMATMFKKEVNISPPEAMVWDNKIDKLSNVLEDEEHVVKVSFRLTVGNMIDSEIMQLLSLDNAKEIIDAMMGTMSNTSNDVAASTVGENLQETNTNKAEEQFEDEVSVQKVQFMPFNKESNMREHRNIDLILDVPIEISVILGRTKKTIKDVLELTNGSLVELDKLVEEPVEILVNGKMVAQGEVVVVNENFGVRLTNIVSNIERVKGLGGK